jgi:hypothetical protein
MAIEMKQLQSQALQEKKSRKHSTKQQATRINNMKGSDEISGDESFVEEIASKSATRKKNKLPKGTKARRKTELRRRNLGVGIGKIDIGSTHSNKIRFNDNFIAEESEEDQIQAISEGAEDDESDDDEAVEQVSSSKAREAALELREAERKTRVEEKAKVQKRKRKKKIDSYESDEDLDEDFLAMVDSHRETEAQTKSMKKRHEDQGNLNRHTTFISNDDEQITLDGTINVGHNIEVVLLPGGMSNEDDGPGDESMNKIMKGKYEVNLSANLSTVPSEGALAFMRSSLTLGRKQETGIKNSFIKRSRRMKYSVGKKMPAKNFLVKKKGVRI